MSKARAEAEGIFWLAQIGAAGMIAELDPMVQSQSANAIRDACDRGEFIPPGDLPATATGARRNQLLQRKAAILLRLNDRGGLLDGLPPSAPPS